MIFPNFDRNAAPFVDEVLWLRSEGDLDNYSGRNLNRMTQEAIQWQPIEQLNYVLELIRGTLAETRTQVDLFRRARTASLDQATVDRAKRLYTERLELNAVFREQLARWPKLPISQDQEGKLQEAAVLLDSDDACAKENLTLAGKLVTIDQILAMDDAEVALSTIQTARMLARFWIGNRRDASRDAIGGSQQ